MITKYWVLNIFGCLLQNCWNPTADLLKISFICYLFIGKGIKLTTLHIPGYANELYPQAPAENVLGE